MFEGSKACSLARGINTAYWNNTDRSASNKSAHCQEVFDWPVPHMTKRHYDTAGHLPDGMRISFYWLGHKSPCDNIGGLATFDGVGPEYMKDVRTLVGASQRRPTMVFNSGMHDISAPFFGYFEYRDQVKKAMAFFKSISDRLIYKNTSPVYEGKECPYTPGDLHWYPKRHQGNPGIELANVIAEEIAHSMGVEILDQHVLRALQTTDGDGVHCAAPMPKRDPPDHYYPIDTNEFQQGKLVGVSCYSTVQVLLNILSFETTAGSTTDPEPVSSKRALDAAENEQQCLFNHTSISLDWKCPKSMKDAKPPGNWKGSRYEAPGRRRSG